MKPELEQQKQIAAEAWAEAERKFLAAVKLKYAAGYIPTERKNTSASWLNCLVSYIYAPKQAHAKRRSGFSLIFGQPMLESTGLILTRSSCELSVLSELARITGKHAGGVKMNSTS